MESCFLGDKDVKEKNIENSLEIKLFFGQEKPVTQNLFEKINFIKSNNIFLFSNETNEKTVLRESQKEQDSNLKIDNINKDNNNKISTIQYIPSLPPSNNKNIIEPFTYSNSCESTISNFADINTNNNNSFNINQTSSPLYINLVPEIKYNPVPEREYYDDILAELFIEEENNSDYKKCLYLHYQKDLNNKKRAELISFIYKMSKLFNFKARTIFLAVQTMDRFLCKEKIDPEYYNLLCICALVIASKFNEIYYPAFKDILSYFSEGKNYTVKQALTMELLILKTINYNLFPIFPMYFFDIISQKCELNIIEYYLGSLMIELIQFDFYLYPLKNSVLAQTVFCKVIYLTKGINSEPLELLKKVFTEEELRLDNENINLIQNASKVIDELLHNLNADYFRDIYQKYSQPDILGNSINYFLNM